MLAHRSVFEVNLARSLFWIEQILGGASQLRSLAFGRSVVQRLPAWRAVGDVQASAAPVALCVALAPNLVGGSPALVR